MTDQKWRWGEPLSFAEADALARKWAEGHIISEVERWRRFRDAIFQYVDKIDRKTRYYTLGQVREHMQSTGALEAEVDIDDNLLAHTICEAECANEFQHLTGPDLDHAYWQCMFLCSPIQGSEAFVVDPLDPRKPPASDVDESKIGQTVYSVAPTGLLVPKNIKRVQ